MKLTLDAVKSDPAVRAYIAAADESLRALGYTEHGFVHLGIVAENAARVLKELGYPQREAELASVAGFMHDIGNVVNRSGHEQSGALMAFFLLTQMGAEAEEVAAVVAAIGNHDELTAFPVSDVAAAVMIADKTDVRHTRVRDQETIAADIHDRVNFAVRQSSVTVLPEAREIRLDLTIDTAIAPISEYFEIFLTRMLLCRKAAARLGCSFTMHFNGHRMM